MPFNDQATIYQNTQAILAGKYVALGDSTTQYNDNVNSFSSIWPHMMCALTQGRLQYTKNAGVAGNTSTDILARFDTDVTPYAPSLVSLMSGTNDVINSSVTDAQTRNNIRATIAKIRGIGATPLLFSIPPFNGNAAQLKRIQIYNAWLARYAAYNDIRFVDAYAQLVDPAGAGNYLASMTVDAGTHPSVAGHIAIAQAGFNILYPSGITTGPVNLLSANTDASNMCLNGLFQVVGTGGFGQSWTLDAAPGTGTVTPSLISDAVMPGGKAQRLTQAAATGGSGFYQYLIGGSFTPGDVIEFGAAINLQSPNAIVQMQSSDGTISVYNQSAIQGRQVLKHQYTISPAASLVTIAFDIYNISGAASGTVDIGGVTIRNLTTGQMVSP